MRGIRGVCMALENNGEIVDLCGAIHLHTTYSDGGANFGELIGAARKAGLDYIIVTDHMTLKGKELGYEGFSGSLFVLIGYEHHDVNKKNHYLAIGTDTVVAGQQDPQEYINAVRGAGGIGFLAHPSEDRHYFDQYPPYPWTNWNVEGFDGIELWNQMSEWVENLKTWRSFFRVFYPRRFLKGIPASLMEKWDVMNRRRFVSGIGGVDAHSYRIPLGFFTVRIFSPKVELKGIRTHVYCGSALSKDRGEAKAQIIAAIRDGRGFISNYRRGDARGTRLYLEYGDGRIVLPGRREGPFSFPASLHVAIPEKVEIRLMRDGQCVAGTKGKTADFAIDSEGVYRIEVYRRGKAWVYSNPFPLVSYDEQRPAG